MCAELNLKTSEDVLSHRRKSVKRDNLVYVAVKQQTKVKERLKNNK